MEDPTLVKNSLTSFFVSVGGNIVGKIESRSRSASEDEELKYMGLSCLKSIVVEPVTEIKAARIVFGLHDSCSSGPDYIPTKAIKHVLSAIVAPLAELVNMILEQSAFPRSLRAARMIALFKGGNRSDPSNYRPISLLSVLSKVFEKPMQKRLFSFLEAKKFFRKHQFGFRFKHTAEQAFAVLLNFIKSALEFGKIPAAIFLYVKKTLR